MTYNELDLAVLKTIINNNKYALEFAHESSERLFTTDLQKFSKLVIDYIKTYKQPPTKRVLIERNRSLKNEGLLNYIDEIFAKIDSINYDEREYKHDLEKVRNRFADKLIGGLKANLSNNEANTDVKKNIATIQTVLSNIKGINQTKIYKDGSLKDYANDFKNIYAAKMQNPEFGTGIKTGYTFIDYAVGGLKPGELLLFAGITASGKSLMLMNTSVQMWLNNNTIDMDKDFKEGCNVLLFSLEMDYEEYMQRVLARLSLVPQRSIREATLTDEEKARVSKALKFIKNYPYTFRVVDLPRRATAETLEIIINEQADKGVKPDIVVIDYMNLMTADVGKDQSDWLIQAAISEQIHELARVKEVILLSAVQLNPKGEGGKDNATGIKALRRATQIADNANFIIGINTRKDEKNYPDFSCSFLKNRKGELVDGKLHKNMTCCALLDQPMSNNDGGDPEDISAQISQSQIE